MATYVQRWTALCEALLNKPATASQMKRAGETIGAIAVGMELYTPMTNEQKAEVAVKYVRQHVIGLVKTADINAAASAAGQGVETEFAEAP